MLVAIVTAAELTSLATMPACWRGICVQDVMFDARLVSLLETTSDFSIEMSRPALADRSRYALNIFDNGLDFFPLRSA